MVDEEKKKTMLEEEHKIMNGYIDSAKTFTQLSLGALVFSITFMEKILGMGDKISVNTLLLLAWIFWLLAALAGAFYQYRAIKRLEELAEESRIIYRRHKFENLFKVYPYIVYGVLLFCFFLGTIFFAVYGAMKIL